MVIDCLLLGALAAADQRGLHRAVLMHTFYEFLARKWSLGPAGQIGRLNGQCPAALWSAADAALIASLPALDPAAHGSLPANTCYTGPVVSIPAVPTMRRTPAPSGGPQVLVSLSTTYYPAQVRTLQAILDALHGIPVRALVSTGPAVDPGQLRPPPNAQLSRYLPHDEVMPGVSLVICHGGHATTMRALAHDRPALIIPVHPMLDQAMIGQALQDQGAGALLPGSAVPDQMRTAVERLLADGPHRTEAARLGAMVREHNGAARAADRLGALLPARA